MTLSSNLGITLFAPWIIRPITQTRSHKIPSPTLRISNEWATSIVCLDMDHHQAPQA